MVSYYVLFWQYSKFFLVRHLQEETWNNSQVPIIKNQKSKKEIPKNQSESLNSSSTASATASSTEKSKTKKRTGACVQADGLSKKVTKKAIVHDIFKGYKITNYGLYMETENGICTGKEGHLIIFFPQFLYFCGFSILLMPLSVISNLSLEKFGILPSKLLIIEYLIQNQFGFIR